MLAASEVDHSTTSSARGKWTKPRMEALVEAVSIHGRQWELIARLDGFVGFTGLQLRVCSKVLFCDIKVPSLTWC